MTYEAIDYWSAPGEYLEHHGVKGMKWGVRKAARRVSSSIKRRKQRRYERSDYAKAKSLSDQELRDRINRINLEQSYISAVERDRYARKEATQSILVRKGKRTLRSIFNIGTGIITSNTKNAINNKIHEKYPITKKPKK